MSRSSDRDIAIVGIGCRFAGAEDLQGFWQLQLRGEDAFGPIPRSRWNHSAVFDPDPGAADKTYSDRGAFIDDIRSFPALALRIPPRRVEVMDPQQRLTLECAYNAVEDAGWERGQLPDNTGVYVGVTATEFRQLCSARTLAQVAASGGLGRAPADPAELAAAVERVVPARPFTAPGSLGNMTAAVVAQELALSGPAFTVDSACSSAMIALEQAVDALRAGRVDAAFAGGAYVCVTPDHYIAFSRVGAMSRAGRCLPFDARADGFLQGEGAGLLLLKRVADAERDGDRIYAVVKGVATNNDGGSEGPMAPVQAGQQAVIELAWADAGVASVEDLGYVEAHGTGTAVGDLVEFEALKGSLGASVRRVALGSAKGNVGHTMSAAGVAGLIRAALAIHHGRIPPMANHESAKPELALEDSPFRIPTSEEAWSAPGRMACVSAFGFGGTNGHAVLAMPRAEDRAEDGVAPQLITMSAPDLAALGRLARRTADAVASDTTATPAAVARAWSRRRRQPARLGIVASNREELVDTLRRFAEEGAAPRSFVGEAAATAPRIAFLYPGQGAQRVGMLEGLRDRYAVVAETLERADGEMQRLHGRGFIASLFPAEGVERAEAEAALRATETCQPALLACGIALTRLLANAGVRPSLVSGHSVGEFAAAVAGGVMSVEQGIRWTAGRGRAMAECEVEDPGRMAAISAGADEVGNLLVDGAVVANVNHPRQVVVSGSSVAVSRVVDRAREEGLRTAWLDVSHGFHSAVFDALDLDELLGSLELQEPQFPVVSCVLARPYADLGDAREAFRVHATAPVRFTRTLEECRALGADVFLQVGAGGPLRAFTRGALAGDLPRAILSAASTDDQDRGASFLRTLAELWAMGVDVEPEAVNGLARPASLPASPLSREEYWAVREDSVLPLDLEAPAPRRSNVAAVSSEPAASEAQATVRSEPPGVLDEGAAGDPKTLVLGAVARASAYPVAALDPALRLVEDLGFDSMMVADLVVELDRTGEGLGGVPGSLLGAGATIGELIDFVASGGDGQSFGTDLDQPLLRYRQIWRAAPLGGEPRSARVRVAGPGDVEAWSAALERAGATLDESWEAEAVVWVTAGAQLPTLRAVLEQGLEPPDLVGDLVAMLSAFAHRQRRPAVLHVRDEPGMWTEGVAGLLRALGREWSDATARSVTVDAGATDAAAALLGELGASDQVSDVRILDGAREVLGMEPAPTGTADWRPGPADAILVTGGTGRIGLELARGLAPSGARIFLASRGAPPPEVHRLIESSSGRIAAITMDVTDRAAVEAGLSSLPPITALVHAAGRLADGPLEEVDLQEGRAVRATKVDGLLNVLRIALPSLRVVLGLGSWAGRFGSRHQLHYSAANAALAEILEQLPGPARGVCVEFGPWVSSAMAATIPDGVKRTMWRNGVDFVGDEVGLTAVHEELASGSGVVIRGRRVPSSTRSARKELVLAPATQPYLLDHRLGDRPVLPLAAAMAAMAEVAGHPAPFEVRDLRILEAIHVEGPRTVIASHQRDQATLEVDGRVAYEALVVPCEVGAEPEPAVVEGGAPERSLESFYEGLSSHGPLLRGIRAVVATGAAHVHGVVAVGDMAAWASDGTTSGFPVDPLSFDASMQLASFAGRAAGEVRWFPTGLERFVQVSSVPPPGEELEAEVRLRDSSEQDEVALLDVVLRLRSGAVLAMCEGLRMQALPADEPGEEAPSPEPSEPFEIRPEWVDPAKFVGYQQLQTRFDEVAALGLPVPYFDVHEGTAADTSVIDGRDCLNFSSYNYLGLTGDPRLHEAVRVAMARYGTSVSASRIASGERPFHRELEALLAASLGTEDAIVFPSGHATNVTVLGHLFGPNDLVLHDELIHDSGLQGIRLSGAARRSFRHEDAGHCEELLEELRSDHEKVLILTEGVYSMDGDVSNTPAFVRLKRAHGCLLMVDEAHSFGTVGARGMGIGEHHGLEGDDVDLWMGTMSKSLASTGGWIAGSSALVTYLRYTTPGFVYAAGMSPMLGQAALTALQLIREEPWRVERLQGNARLFAGELQARGLNVGSATGASPVVPVLTGSSRTALRLANELLAEGINVKPIIYPAVSEDSARLRFFVSSCHSEEQLVRTADLTGRALERVSSSS